MKKLLYTLVMLLISIIVSPNIAMARWEYDILDLPQFKINNQHPIKIALIDSGIIDNDYFRPYVTEGYNFLDNNKDTIDVHGHGTKVASILVDLARETNLNIQLLPLKTVDFKGFSSIQNVVQAINYSIEQDVDIINISMSSKTNNSEVLYAIQNAQDNNIIIVAGAGNDGENTYVYPASYDNVLSVGSISENRETSWFSNSNDKISVVAPGENITTMEIDGSYGIHAGTSFSTAFVTFEVALIKCEHPELTSQEIIRIINETAIDEGEVGFDNIHGNGIVNYSNAINNFDKALREYLDWKTYCDIVLDKSWSVEFNDVVDNAGNTYIIDEYYNIIPSTLKINNDTIIIYPTIRYNENTIYSLIIDSVTSISNGKLKNNVKMKFKTMADNRKIVNKINDIRITPDEMPYIY